MFYSPRNSPTSAIQSIKIFFNLHFLVFFQFLCTLYVQIQTLNFFYCRGLKAHRILHLLIFKSLFLFLKQVKYQRANKNPFLDASLAQDIPSIFFPSYECVYIFYALYIKTINFYGSTLTLSLSLFFAKKQRNPILKTFLFLIFFKTSPKNP